MSNAKPVSWQCDFCRSKGPGHKAGCVAPDESGRRIKPPTKAEQQAIIEAKFARRVLKLYEAARDDYHARISDAETRIIQSNPQYIVKHCERITKADEMNGYVFTDDTGQRWLLRYGKLRELAEKEVGTAPILRGMLQAFAKGSPTK